MGKCVDLTGKKFTRLTVIARHGSTKSKKAVWLCQCECGGKTKVTSQMLTSGRTKSCGCLHKEQLSAGHSTHCLSKTRLHKAWCNMKTRCYNQNNKDYSRYGGRGIIMCDEWKNDFVSFYNWAIINGYNDMLTLDRIDNNGNYEPSNCRWITMQKQCNNRHSNHMITYNGETHTISEWSEIVGMSRDALVSRLRRGWDIEKTLTTPVNKK